ncbi:arylamine N-acetyltransferase [Streptomyces albofaciens JCM 4342]|uniref:arylamine N-acetyltransferase family protein n=1 Tax=Streptomyces albofaciens TaxID=66866 RepID=UPI00123C1FA3|nr:arylamine N-acetyltransferase [Streptomyces albofaciens]KAA6214814.1 arylamine N-acetyltransferase [Streptomyces albofaciens JCM 4342]
MSDTVWGGDQLDLDAYLARIGYEGERAPTEAALRELHARHAATFGFENLEIVLGRPVPLDLKSLQEKMVGRRRGGYCYEQNLLYAAALDRLGFQVSGLGARIRMGESKIRPVTHALLKVRLDGEDWITDVGFGGEALLAPLPLRDGIEVRQGGWTFGLVREEAGGTGSTGGAGGADGTHGTDAACGTWVLRSRHEDGWFDLYAFGQEARYPADYGIFNYYISTHPRSPFTGRLVVQRPGPDLRRTLIGTELTLTRPDWSRVVRQVPAGELPAVLESDFDLVLDERDAAELVALHREQPVA